MISESEYHSRRVKLLQNIDEGVFILSSTPIKNRSNDTDYRYRQNSDFYYLTGLNEPNAIVVLSKNSDETRSYLFLNSHDDDFALWNGDSTTIESADGRFMIDELVDIDNFESKISDILANHTTLYIDLYDTSEPIVKSKEIASNMRQMRGVKNYIRVFIDVLSIIRELRAIKSPAEIELIKKAIAVTANAHHEIMRRCTPELYEYQLQATFEYICSDRGAKNQAYEPIVAGGDSANTLHYIANNQRLVDGDMVLVDAGCEYELYSSDITRSFPVNGKFSSAQKELYNAILEAQLEIIDAVKPSITRAELQSLSERLLSQALIDLGIINERLEIVLENRLFKRYYPHGIGHWMGLDVHDPCPYYDENGSSVTLRENMVLTIEPALYFRADDMSVPERFRGIGIRIEDNILVTAAGSENLSSAIAKTTDEIEAIMASCSSSH